mmetsp:Transcript_7483/g.11806  ORF Transcript_7483/g.11806 Transcript_7483/m.11806 type:complete len:130 (-) Transcript_7483:529-918(-)
MLSRRRCSPFQRHRTYGNKNSNNLAPVHDLQAFNAQAIPQILSYTLNHGTQGQEKNRISGARNPNPKQDGLLGMNFLHKKTPCTALTLTPRPNAVVHNANLIFRAQKSSLVFTTLNPTWFSCRPKRCGP